MSMIPSTALKTDKGGEALPALRLVHPSDGGTGRHLPAGRTAGYLSLLESLDGLIVELDKLPNLTEKSFLAVCASLHDLSGRLQGISEKAGQAALIMSGPDMLSVIAGLRNALRCMEEHLATTNRTASRAVAGLGLIIGELDDIRQLMADFKERVGTLRMLKMITNIQGACLTKGAAGFQKVAADIGTLSHNVQTKSAAIMDKKRVLSAELHKAVTMVSALQDSQRDLTGRFVADIRHGIVSLADMHEKCSMAAEQIAGRSVAISHELSEVVVALQFQDITRQQLEHARKALAEVQSQLRKALREDPVSDLPISTGSICALQAAQIANSNNELKGAVARIVNNLEGLAREASTASAGVHNLFGLAGSVGQSSIVEIETGLSSVLTAFTENMTTAGHLTRIMLAVTTAMGELTSFAEDIDFIGSEIKLIALNAIIKAAQAGKDGAAFGVIAATVKQQSEEICKQASTINATIGKITVHVKMLQAELPSEEIASSEVQTVPDNIGRDMAAAIVTLKSLSGTVMDLLAQTDNTATGLAADIGTSIDCLNNRELRRVVQMEIPAHLDLLALSLRRLDPVRSADGGLNSIDTLQQQYTMWSERKVHEQFAAEAFACRGFSPVAPAGADDDFGDNVELF